MSKCERSEERNKGAKREEEEEEEERTDRGTGEKSFPEIKI